MTTSSEQFDAIIIDAGHNGLTCACYLARAGLKVRVLEQYHSIGGMTITEEITLPGFRSVGTSLHPHRVCNRKVTLAASG